MRRRVLIVLMTVIVTGAISAAFAWPIVSSAVHGAGNTTRDVVTFARCDKTAPDCS